MSSYQDDSSLLSRSWCSYGNYKPVIVGVKHDVLHIRTK